MTMSKTLLAIAAAATALLSPVVAQTSTKCNPLTSGNCPADPALGKSVTIDFTQGSSNMFTTQGNPTYDGNGASFSIAKSGDAPTLISNFYIMFGQIEIVMKASPGVGIVSTLVMQSDDLDEIDWEILGSDNTQVQTNYFGKGQTGSYNRGGFAADPGNQQSFQTYTITWDSNQVVWSLNGNPVRTLTAAAAGSQYPQTPMQLKIGSWSAGDPSNAPGTVQWAGGSTNYAAGPFTMQVKSVKATDYSTGTQYTYGGTSGSWQSIQAAGGTVNPSGSASPGSSSSTPSSSSSASSSSSSSSGSSTSQSSSTLSTSTVPSSSTPGGGSSTVSSGVSMTTSVNSQGLSTVVPVTTSNGGSNSQGSPASPTSAGTTSASFTQAAQPSTVTKSAGQRSSSSDGAFTRVVGFSLSALLVLFW